MSRAVRVTSEHSRDAIAAARAGGLPIPDAPEQEPPRLPEDITLLDDEGLMDLFGQLTAWADFASTQVACAQVDERAAQRALDLAEARATGKNWSTGDRVAVMKKRVAEDDDVLRATRALDERYAYRKVVESIQSNIDRDTALISRELTRRTSALPRRKDRWTT